MSHLKLVKNTKRIKRKQPKIRNRSVQQIIKLTISKALEHQWDRIIVIGQGSNHGGVYHSIMTTTEVLGMLEEAKMDVYDDR